MKKKNKFLVFCIVLCMLFSMVVVPLSAEILDSGLCGDNLTWTLGDSGTLTITGTGDMWDYSFGSFPSWFDYADSLIITTTIVIENGVTSIGDWSFFAFAIKSITLPNSVTSIGSSAFNCCSALEQVFIPNSVTSIGDQAFYDCKRLTSIIIPDSVTSIGDEAFIGCESLSSIVIPDSVTSIGINPFLGCYMLNSIRVFEDNAFYSSVDEVLFDKDKTNLIACSCVKSGNYTIPDSVTSIGYEAFCACKGLTSVVIPKGVTSIGDFAFYYCTNLANVYYGGNEKDWNNISIGTFLNDLTNATIHYNHIQSKALTNVNDYNGETVTLLENGVLDIGENLYFRNGYVNAQNGYIKSGDRKITGEKIYFTNDGKMHLQDGCTAKVEKDNGDGTTDQGFMAGIENPNSIITMTLEVTGTANDVDYTGKTISKDFDFTNYEVAGLVNFGFTVNNIPKPLSLSLQSIE